MVGKTLVVRDSFEEGDKPVSKPGSLWLVSLEEHLAIKSQFSKIPIQPSCLEPERNFITGFLHIGRDSQRLS